MENVYKRTGILFKILPCIFLVIFIGMICCSSCFASFDITCENKTFTLPDLPVDVNSTSFKNVFIVLLYRTDVYADGSPYYTTAELYYTNSDSFYYKSFNASGYFCSLSSGDPTEWISKTGNSWSSLKDRSNGNIIVFSKNDVLNEDGSVVFQNPPQEKPLEGIIAKQIQPKEMNKTLQEIVGILPIVMIVVVSYLALRKALKMLSTLLKQS